MAPAGAELLVGVVDDPHFGPVLACGAGGTTVELVHDVAVRITPLTDRDAHDDGALAADVPAARRLPRRAEADVAALEDVLLRVSALVDAHPEIVELDCNPVVVTPTGATVVDIRARVQPVRSRPPLPSVAE